VGSDIEFPSEDEAIGTIRYQVIGSIDGALYRGLRDNSATGEKVIYRLRLENGHWRIISIDPDRGTWR